MKKIIYFFSVLLVLSILAFITKPSDYECRETAADNKMQSYDAVLFEGLARKIVIKGIEIDDYILFKKIKFSFDGETRDLGWAAFGQVFIND